MPGNPLDFENISDLHAAACKLLDPYFEGERREKTVQFEELVPERKSTDIREILPAIFEGKVDTLFLQKNVEICGNYNKNMASVEIFNPEINAVFRY